jgi:hypothetical protein
MKLWKSQVYAVVMSVSCIACAQVNPNITAPTQALGFSIGDDYRLANYTQLAEYWKKLSVESDRMKLVDIGTTAEGRRQYMAIITSPDNMKKLDRYREISRKLSLAENLTDDQAHDLALEGKSVVWIDGGLHASETVGSQQLVEFVYEMLSRTDAETTRFLNDEILLCVLDNPDGMELVSDWYMRIPDPSKRTTSNEAFSVPRLWHKYVGHDNNRDFFMSNMPETTNINRVLFREWFPQIMYNHHQTGPIGTVIFVPPFRDPFNYHYDPLIPLDIEAVGVAIHSRLVEENKPGSTMRSGTTYSTWYNGGLRTSTYFHNQIGILTEIIGSPTPMEVPLLPAKQLPTGDLPYPVKPQTWHLRQSIDYEMTNNRAIMDYASRNRETLLYNIYRMGKNSIQRGNEDSWTITPRRIEALDAEGAAAKAKEKAVEPKGKVKSPASTENNPPGSVPTTLYETVLHDSSKRDPRGYIIPSDQPDFPTATKFINTLLKNGVTVLKATSEFGVNQKHYPAGSYVVKTAQAFRPQVLDMFEPQDHPNDFKFPGGPPIAPYDVTGYTLALQMGVQFDRVFHKFDGPFETITTELERPLPGAIIGPVKPAGYLVSHAYNDTYTLTNRLLKAGSKVYWLKGETKEGSRSLGTGTLWIPYSSTAHDLLDKSAKELGITAYAQKKGPQNEAVELHPVRIGLFDQYGGLVPSGWTRWLLEQFEFPYEIIYPKTLDAGNLKNKVDVLIFTDGAIRAAEVQGEGNASSSILLERGRSSALMSDPEKIPEQYRPWLGVFTAEKSLPQVRTFIENGGAVIAIGSSTGLAQLLALPVRSALTEKGPDGKDRTLPKEKFYIPGSLLRAQVDNKSPLAYGMPDNVDMFFDNRSSFRLLPDSALKGVSTVAWYGEKNILDSGWAWGQQYLYDSSAVVEASLGKGKVFLFGPEVAFRGQPHATFKFLFNGILYGNSNPVKL